MIQQKNINKLDAKSIIQLANTMIDKHRQEGCHSPLDPGLIAKLNFKLSQAMVYHEESEKYRELYDQAQKKRDAILGFDQEGGIEKSLIVNYLESLVTMLDQAELEDVKAAS